MRIKEMVSQHRRDFRAIFICEHCDSEESCSGYDDAYFHNNVIPKMKCKQCGLAAADTYEPQATKYPDGMVI